MTEKYEKTGETKVEHARANKIRGIESCFEIAVSKDVYEQLLSFVKSRGNLSISFDASIEGYTELFCIYRFVNEEKTRTNIFMHTDQFGYEELITINTMTGDNGHINACTTEGHAYSFYPVDDIEKYEVSYLIGHILGRLIKLNNILEDPEEKEISEVAFDYMKMLSEKYK